MAEEGTKTEENLAEMIAIREALVLVETGWGWSETTHLLDIGHHHGEEEMNNVQGRLTTVTNHQETTVLKALVKITRPKIQSEPLTGVDD